VHRWVDSPAFVARERSWDRRQSHGNLRRLSLPPPLCDPCYRTTYCQPTQLASTFPTLFPSLPLHADLPDTTCHIHRAATPPVASGRLPTCCGQLLRQWAAQRYFDGPAVARLETTMRASPKAARLEDMRRRTEEARVQQLREREARLVAGGPPGGHPGRWAMPFLPGSPLPPCLWRTPALSNRETEPRKARHTGKHIKASSSSPPVSCFVSSPPSSPPPPHSLPFCQSPHFSPSTLAPSARSSCARVRLSLSGCVRMVGASFSPLHPSFLPRTHRRPIPHCPPTYHSSVP